MKFNQFGDDAAKKFEIAQAVNFADLAKHAQLSQLQSQCTNYFKNFFFNGKGFTLRGVNWRDLINGNYLKVSPIGVL